MADKNDKIMKLRKLKFYAITATLIVFGCMSGYSQQQQTSDESALTPKIGIKGGVNITNLYTDNVKDENSKVGFNAGFFAKIPLVQGVSIQPELLYTTKGAQLTYDNIIQGSGKYKFNLNYVETPLLMVFNVTKNFNINGGAYLAYLTSANIKDVDNNGDVNGVTDLNADKFNRFDYGLVGGLGFDIENITIGARYNYGLREIGKSGSLSGDLTQNSKNSALSLFIGIGF